jgi:hypothetical protein
LSKLRQSALGDWPWRRLWQRLMFAGEMLVNRGHDGLPSELLFLPGIPKVLHHSISNLVCEKHEPRGCGLRAVTSGRNTLRQFGRSQFLHQFVWKSHV